MKVDGEVSGISIKIISWGDAWMHPISKVVGGEMVR